MGGLGEGYLGRSPGNTKILVFPGERPRYPSPRPPIVALDPQKPQKRTFHNEYLLLKKIATKNIV